MTKFKAIENKFKNYSEFMRIIFIASAYNEMINFCKHNMCFRITNFTSIYI